MKETQAKSRQPAMSHGEPSAEEWDLARRESLTTQTGPALPRRLLAVILVLAFVGLLIGGVLQLLQLPSVQALWEAQLPSHHPTVAKTRAGVVYVRALSAGGPGSSGTGFNVHPTGVIVTNRHVVQGASTVVVSFQSGANYAAQQIYVAPQADLAVLWLHEDGLPTLELARSATWPQKGHGVTIIGNPLGVPGISIAGEIVGQRPLTGGRWEWEIRAPIHQGHSGSPVLDGHGAVIGMVYAMTRAQPPVGLAVSAPDMLAFIDALRSRGEIP